MNEPILIYESRKLWDAISGEQKATYSHNKIVKDALFSPDETKLITGGFEKILRVWDVNVEEVPVQQMAPQEHSIKHIVWNGLYSDLIVTASGDSNQLRCYDHRSTEIVSTFEVPSKTGSPETVTSMSITRDGVFIIVTTESEVILFNARKMTPLLHFSVGAGVSCAAMEPSGDRFVAGHRNFSVEMYGMDGVLQNTLTGHHGPVHWVSYAPDGRTFASGSDDGTVRIWQNEVEEHGLWQSPPIVPVKSRSDEDTWKR